MSACSSGSSPTHPGGSTLACGACVASIDCLAQDECGLLADGAFCVRTCSTSSDCTAGLICTSTKTSEGTATKLCVSENRTCGTSPTPTDAGTSGRDTDAAMSRSDAGVGSTPDLSNTMAPGFTSNITTSGGTESQLFFAVIGDTRPYNTDDTTNYPASPPLPACTTSNDKSVGTDTASCGAITKIYQDIQAANPRPPFVISTGDYQYATPGKGDSATQVGYYVGARANYTGVEWPAMGNHECDGYTASNCATGCPSGDSCSGANTENFLTFQTKLLAPIGETLPYYTRTVTATDNSWTAHFIFVAPNYWDTTQETWLKSQLAAAGTSSTSNYIFVIHHEDATAGDPSSLSTIESAEKSVETVSIVGHSHTWAHGGSNSKELLVGNGGVPSTSVQNLGYTTITRQANGQLVISNYDFMTLHVVNTYTVTP
jgi:hypothetical protein